MRFQSAVPVKGDEVLGKTKVWSRIGQQNSKLFAMPIGLSMGQRRKAAEAGKEKE